MLIKKIHKKKIKGYASNGFDISFGKYGLKAINKGVLNLNQIESARKVISKYIKKNGKLWIRIFPDKPVTKKAPEIRMGNGKGNFDHYIFQIKPGKILYEVSGSIVKYVAKKALLSASYKLPLKTIFITI